MGSPLGAPPMFQSNLYGTIVFINFKLIENGLIYTNKDTGKQFIILELK